MTSSPRHHRPSSRTIGARRAMARQLARDLVDPPDYSGHDWPSAAMDVPARWPLARQMLAEIKQATAEAACTPGRSWIGYRRATGDAVIIIHARDWSLVFAAHGQSGIDATIYLVFDADFGAFPAVLRHDSRRAVEFSHLFHETFGAVARCWD